MVLHNYPLMQERIKIYEKKIFKLPNFSLLSKLHFPVKTVILAWESCNKQTKLCFQPVRNQCILSH
jgi:hypothetical protein